MSKASVFRALLAGSTLTVGGLALTACASTPAVTASPTASAPVAAATATAQSSAAPATAQSSAAPETVPPASFKSVTLQKSNGILNFESPTGNIMCTVFYRVSGSRDGAVCQTQKPPVAVTLNSDGTYQMCQTNANSQACVTGDLPGTPTLGYGDKTSDGPFLCWSEDTGVSCTANGKGLKISTSGVAVIN